MTDQPRAPRLAPTDLLGGLFLVALGLVARCARWSTVFTADGVDLVPADSHYYIRFALRQLAQFPRFDRFDPYVNHPTGAEIYWPPLHTWIVGAFLKAFGLQRLELGAAWVDPILAVVGMLILGYVAWRLHGRAAAAITLALYALLPASIYCSPLGDADHHVHEPFFAALTCLLLGSVVQLPSTGGAVALGLTLGLSRLFTPIEPLLLVPTAAALVVTIGLLSTSAGAPFRWFAVGTGLTAATVLMASALLFGNPTSFEYEPLTAFQPLFALSLFLGVSAAGAMLHRDRRWWLWTLLALVCLLPLVPELRRALGHLGRADPILATVEESQPLTLLQARDLLNVVLLCLPIILIGAVRRIRLGGFAVLPALVFSAVLVVPAIKQFRFVQVFTGAVIVLAALALPAVFHGMARATLWKRTLYTVGAVVLLMGAWPAPPRPEKTAELHLVRKLMYWLRSHTPVASHDPMGDTRPLYGVVANPMLGHFLAFWADRPAVASSFSQAPTHVAGNERVADVFSATSEDEAFQKARATGGRYLIVTPLLKPFGREGVDFHHTYVANLLETAELQSPGATRFRLLYDSPEQGNGHSVVRVFEVVEGAQVQGETTPNATVTVDLNLVDNERHELRYQRSVRADATGRFTVRVPYPTDDPQAGIVQPAPGSRGLWVTNGTRATYVQVPLDAVESGSVVPVAL